MQLQRQKHPSEVDVMYIKGVGPKVAYKLNKLGIFTAQDLMMYFPKKHIDYSCSFTTEVEENYIGDSMKIQQILINIIGNAMKFTPEYGKVTFEIKQEKVTKKDALIRFTISDNGIGISKEFLPNLFNTFDGCGKARE